MIDNAITGIAREFYIRMGEHFPDGYYDQHSTGIDGINFSYEKGDPAFFFESHVAEAEFDEMIA